MRPARRTRRRVSAAGIVAILLLATSFSAARAQRAEPAPRELEGVGIDERLDQAIPLDLVFVNAEGKREPLASYFKPGRPVILTLVYYQCPMLCTLVLNGLVEALKEVDLEPGKELEILTISFDPVETPSLARLKKQNYVTEYGRPGAAAGWDFLVGAPAEIGAITSAVGFRYKWSEETKQFVHAAVAVVLTPEGRISRYLYGVMFDPKTVRLSLVEAAKGGIGSTFDQILLYCFHYDANAGRYSLAAVNLMRISGIFTVLILGAVLSILWMRERGRKRIAPTEREP